MIFEEVRQSPILNQIQNFANLDYELIALGKGINKFIDSESKENPLSNILVQTMDNVGDYFSKEETSELIKNTLRLVIKGENCPKDYYGLLEKSFEKSENNQPLGILIGELAAERKIPFVLATSSYHHDELTQPVSSYANSKGWILVDCDKGKENEKATPNFWNRAHKQLNELKSRR